MLRTCLWFKKFFFSKGIQPGKTCFRHVWNWSQRGKQTKKCTTYHVPSHQTHSLENCKKLLHKRIEPSCNTNEKYFCSATATPTNKLDFFNITCSQHVLNMYFDVGCRSLKQTNKNISSGIFYVFWHVFDMFCKNMSKTCVKHV